MDWNYLHCELEKLGLVDFERDSRLLAEKVLTDQPVTLTEPESKMLDFLTRSGTYGALNLRPKRISENHAEGSAERRTSQQAEICLAPPVSRR